MKPPDQPRDLSWHRQIVLRDLQTVEPEYSRPATRSEDLPNLYSRNLKRGGQSPLRPNLQVQYLPLPHARNAN
ncbi:hypothetical protein TNIN_362491 [Trichonephila inaurata madagascariensis]|uniref:Uncharacterized protein n=1 Tax=Trichonephila inaurata madagascariensis TaxID=2747483 RepID=A0A8X6YHQ8_9ARAC|nr:hypothetical protein TNIN_362491 [Trichonephila inaurata madagascariensis]